MNRRDVLQALAMCGLASLPLAQTKYWEYTNILENEDFVLDEPLRLRMSDGFVIRNCTFKVTKRFPPAKSVVYLEGAVSGAIHNCYIQGPAAHGITVR